MNERPLFAHAEPFTARRRLLTHADECELAFRWQHCRDKRSLHALVLAFNPLLFSIAAERFRKAQLDKGVQIIDLVKARSADERLGGANKADLAGHFKELLAAGTVGLIEAVSLYNGKYRFSTYARHWVFKRMQEYVRANWNVVRLRSLRKKINSLRRYRTNSLTRSRIHTRWISGQRDLGTLKSSTARLNKSRPSIGR
jgi:hypothetical protein